MVELSVEGDAQGQTAGLQVDPFGFSPGVASKIGGLGGDAPGHDPAYVFHTPYVRAKRGIATFTVRFTGLVAKRGTLMMRVHMFPDEEGAPARLVNSERITLNRLIAIGGEVTLRFEAFRGMTYAVYGMIPDQTDAFATGLTVTLDHPDDGSDTSDVVVEAHSTRFSTDKVKPSAHLLSLDPPTITDPVAQMCTAAQFRERTYRRWTERLRAPEQVDRHQWELVYVLQVLDYFGMLSEGARGLGFGAAADPLPAALAAAGVSVVATAPTAPSPEDLYRPTICDDQTFANHVEVRAADPTAIAEDLVNFDFVWSRDTVTRLGSIAAGFKFVEGSLACLRPGGIAVHLLDFNVGSYEETVEEGDTVLFRRKDVERLTLGMISRGHEVAQIKPAGVPIVDQTVATGDDDAFPVTSFGIIVRKAASPF